LFAAFSVTGVGLLGTGGRVAVGSVANGESPIARDGSFWLPSKALIGLSNGESPIV